MRYIDLYELRVGDKFMEDRYPEIHKVVRIEKKEDYANEAIVAVNLENGEECDWFYHKVEGRAYAPQIILLARGE